MLTMICYLMSQKCWTQSSLITDGTWTETPDIDYCKQYMCTEDNLTWVPDKNSRTGPFKIYNNVTACDALLAKGYTMMFFSGDSYMRQIYAALMITLTGDYKYGSIKNPETSPHCEYGRQFYEKKCGTRDLNHYGQVCDGKITLDPILQQLPYKNDLELCSRSPKTVIMWSFGNYNVINGRANFNMNGGRRGVNNATEYQKLLQSHICPTVRAEPPGDKCSLYWVSTHYRMKHHFPDETIEQVKTFNEGMHSFFGDSPGSSGSNTGSECGDIGFIDVYNMTENLAQRHAEEAIKLTYDSVHWGMEVNLIKAQIILNRLINAP